MAKVRLNTKEQPYQLLPQMTAEEFTALKNDIKERGVIVPIDLDEDGNILDGHHRVRACQQLGITDYPTIIRPNLTENEKRMFARRNNMMRRHLSTKQKQEIIEAQLKDTTNWSNSKIAKELGVSDKTVGKLRNKLEGTSEIPKLNKLIGIDNKVRYKKRPALMCPNTKIRNSLMKDLKKAGVDIEKLQGKGFLTTEQFQTITTRHPLDVAKEQMSKKEWDKWLVFVYYLQKERGHSKANSWRMFEHLTRNGWNTVDELHDKKTRPWWWKGDAKKIKEEFDSYYEEYKNKDIKKILKQQ